MTLVAISCYLVVEKFDSINHFIFRNILKNFFDVGLFDSFFSSKSFLKKTKLYIILSTLNNKDFFVFILRQFLAKKFLCSYDFIADVLLKDFGKSFLFQLTLITEQNIK